MGFLLNGKRWVDRSEDFKTSSTRAVRGNNTLYVKGLNSTSQLLFLFEDPKTGEYQLKNEESVQLAYYNSDPEPVLLLNDSGNKLKITYYDGKIIAGTFQLVFKLHSGELLTITSGRFDILIR
ncbi:DUF6252 family protein [Desertivirga brevis]|uniref:DUF6252 family protein n=1 Tax=Desertivirga brevis TaxID=2810310 RepID=UPI001A958BB4|nr:DUF6252 family protein [Pedobacter sp. SYSU D00873]